MKKVILNILFLSSLCMSAQNTVYETELSKDNPLIRCNYLPKSNKLIIKGRKGKFSQNDYFNNALSIDSNKQTQKIVDNQEFTIINASLDEKNFSTKSEQVINSNKVSHFNIEGKDYVATIKKDECLPFFIHYSQDFFNIEQVCSFDNTGMYSVVSDKSHFRCIDIEKEDLLLLKYDFIKKGYKSIPFKKPNIDRLKTKDLDVPSRITFQSRFYGNNTFEIVTKSLLKNHTSSTLYRTIYGFDGKQIKEYAYTYNSPDGGLTYVGTNSIYENQYNKKNNTDAYLHPMDLDVNDYYIDPITEDVYIYGITSIKAPYQFYLIKFKKDGEKIYEKFYPLNKKEALGGVNENFLRCFISLDEYMSDQKVLISVSSEKSYNVRYNNSFIINKTDGSIEKQDSYLSNEESSKGTFALPQNHSLFSTVKLNKNKFCSRKTLAPYTLNKQMSNYINSVPTTKKDVYFDVFTSVKGVWLMETDNDNYYKVTLFNE